MNRLDWFSVFKYLVYAALVANVALFFKEDWEAASHVFQDGLPFARIIEGFAPSIDTAAWVILLLLFELETCQLSDEVLKRPIGLAIRGLRALCYMVIVYAFTGYLGKALGFGLYVPAGAMDACALAMKQFALLVELDEYRALTVGNCAGITGELFVNEQTRTLAEAGTLVQAARLAWVDVVNSGTWLLILALLELDVRPGVKGLFPAGLRPQASAQSICSTPSSWAPRGIGESSALSSISGTPFCGSPPLSSSSATCSSGKRNWKPRSTADGNEVILATSLYH